MMTDAVGVFCLKPKEIRFARPADLNFTLQTTDSMQTARQWLKTQAICCLLVCPGQGDRCLGCILQYLAGSGHSIPIFVVAPEEEWRRIENYINSLSVIRINLNDPTRLPVQIEAEMTRVQLGKQMPLPPVSPRIRRALKFMRQHIARIQSAAEVSGFLGVAQSTFLNELRRECNVSFRTCLSDLKIEYAMFLAKSNLTAREISQRCGYTSEFTFHRTFKIKQGVTFSAYRKNLNKNIEKK